MGIETKKQQRRQHEYDVDMLQREQQFNAEQAQQAYDRQREFYDYQFQNESQYNSPLAQLQRYKQAGMNPALMQLNEGNTSVSASSPPAASASGSNSVNFAQFQSNQLQAASSIAGILNEFQKVQSEIDLNKTSAAKNIAEADKTAGVDTEKTRVDIKNVLADTENKKAEKNKIIADTDLSKTQKENVEQQTENLRYTLKHLLPKQGSEIDKRIEKMTNDILNSQQLTKAQCAEMFQNIVESVSRVDLNNRQSDLVWKQIQAFDDRLAAELNISREQFQQLRLGNTREELVNGFFNDFVNGAPLSDALGSIPGVGKLLEHAPGYSKKNADQLERYFKLMQLKTLNMLNLGMFH